jgi:hypothetical protein
MFLSDATPWPVEPAGILDDSTPGVLSAQDIIHVEGTVSSSELIC